MTKKTILVVSAACALGLLCVSGVYISTANLNKANPSAIVAYSAKGNISYICVQRKDAEKIVVELNNDKWENVGDKGVSLNQSLVQELANRLKMVTATTKIKKAENLSQYGLESPTIKIEFATDTETTTYLLGLQNAHTSDYYFAIDETSEIYTVSSAVFESLNCDLLELMNVSATPTVLVDEIHQVTLKQSGEAVVLNSNDYQYTVNGKNANKDAIANYFNAINDVSFEKCVAYKPISLAEYGMDNPAATLEISYTKDMQESVAQPISESYTLVFGGGSAEGTRYVMLKDSQMVCTANAQMVADITEIYESDFVG